MVKILVPKNSPFDAINFYLDILREGLRVKGEDVIIVHSIDEINKEDTVITVWALSFLQIWLKKKPKRILNWFQGIQSEETFLWFKETKMEKHLRRFAWRWLERITLRLSHGNIFVSESMRYFFATQYGYRKDNYFIMPCFNTKIHKDSFTCAGKYNTPSFVYAGGMSAWQCIDEVLQLYKLLKTTLPNARLTLLTGDREQALALLDKYNLADVEIKYVPYLEINGELEKYKYGFLLRDDIAINHVATPTKMSTYMANGVIPVYSNVIGDFKDVFKDMKYVVRVEPAMGREEIAAAIKAMEATEISPLAVSDEYAGIFDTYYAADNYVNQISKHKIFKG